MLQTNQTDRQAPYAGQIDELKSLQGHPQPQFFPDTAPLISALNSGVTEVTDILMALAQDKWIRVAVYAGKVLALSNSSDEQTKELLTSQVGAPQSRYGAAGSIAHRLLQVDGVDRGAIELARHILNPSPELEMPSFISNVCDSLFLHLARKKSTESDYARSTLPPEFIEIVGDFFLKPDISLGNGIGSLKARVLVALSVFSDQDRVVDLLEQHAIAQKQVFPGEEQSIVNLLTDRGEHHSQFGEFESANRCRLAIRRIESL